MKLGSHFRRGLLFGVLLLISIRVNADIVILKSGDRKEGTIIAEDDFSVTLQYQLTTKLKDWVKILKADIKEIIRRTPAQVEYEAKGLDKVLPTENLLSASDYESIIQDYLRTFVAKHPGTPEAEKVKKMIDTLNEEKHKVLGRQVKMECVWLDEDTARREKYNIEAYRLRLQMKKKMEDLIHDQLLPKEIKALRAFDDLRTHYPASPQYLQAIPEAIDILDKYEKRLLVMRAEQPVLKAEREKAVSTSTGKDQDRIRGAIDQEERAFRATLDAQTKANAKWKDIYKYDLKSIQDAQALVAKEKQNLKSINVRALQNEIESLNAAIRHLADGNAAEADAIMDRLRPIKDSLINEKVFDELERQLTLLHGR